MKRLLLLTLLPLMGCHVNPTVSRKPDGSFVATTGGSIFSNSASESGTITMPDGLSVSYSKTGKDETTGVKDIARGMLLAKTAIHALDSNEAIKTGEQVTQRAATAGKYGVQKAKIAADVTKATFVPPEAPVPAP